MATYEVMWDTAAHRLEFVLAGNFDPETFAAWDRVFRAAVLKARRPGWTCLGDVSDLSLLREESFQDGAGQMMAFARDNGCLRSAMVVAGVETAAQVEQLSTDAGTVQDFAIVSSRQEGLRWLDDTASPALR